MNSAESPKLEYNLAGGLALTIFGSDFEELCHGLAEAGYRHACVLPFRALSQDSGVATLRNNLNVVHIERAWNPTKHDFFPTALLAGMMGMVKRARGDESQPPIVQDALFPGKATCERLLKDLMKAFPSAKFISYSLKLDFPQDRVLLGLTSGIELSYQEILEYSEHTGIGLVFDPSHLLAPEKAVSAPGLPTKASKGEWERQFNRLSSRIEVVDINPSGYGNIAVDALLKRNRGILKELAAAAREARVKFLRVEIPIPKIWQIPGKIPLPGLPSHQKGFEFLQEIGQALLEEN